MDLQPIIANSNQKEEFTTIKRSLNAILLNNENKERIKEAIAERSICMTRILAIGSLYVLDIVNNNVNNNNFQFFERNPTEFLTECFQSFTPNQCAQNLPQVEDEFKRRIFEFNIQFSNCQLLGNVLKYAIDTYRVNFQNNIILHARKRIKLFFRICGVHATAEEIEHTIKYMFESNSRVQPNLNLIHVIPNIDEVSNTMYPDGNGQNGFERGFFREYVKDFWFESVFIFRSIQVRVYDYQVRCQRDRNLRKVKNFTVVPMSSFKRHHVRLDNESFFCVLKELNIDPKKKSVKKTETGFSRITIEQFIKNKSKYWFEHFNKKKFKSMEKKQKKFHYQIVSDGVSASILFNNKNRSKKLKSDDYIDIISEKYSNEEYNLVCGFDPGYKNWLGGVVRDEKNGEEKNIKITSKQFHNKTGKHKRVRKAKRWTKHFERAAAMDREDRNIWPETPSPCSRNWFNYVLHRLKMFNDGIRTYTQAR